MKRSEVKAGLQTSIGNILTDLTEAHLDMKADFGKFFCAVETLDDLTIITRNFETSDESLHIPFSCNEPALHMMFSLNGRSLLNNRIQPFILEPSSHCINFFTRYNCANMLPEGSRQHDIVFRLNKSFYRELVAQHLSSADDRLAAMIAGEQEFNTINQHRAMDAGVSGILKNILDCPFEGDMRKVFIREHLRALFMLQLFHFNPVVAGKQVKMDTKITSRDRKILHDVRRYIDAHFLEPASLEGLSRTFGLNEFKLKHGFRTLFDTSPIRYLQQKRMTFALSLLRKTDKTIREISSETGYSHAANFTTAFVKTFGKSPLHYRKSAKIDFESP